MLKDTLTFYSNIEIDKNIIEKILGFNYNNIESISEVDLSKYCIILSQYLVYFKWQFNCTRADQFKLKNKLEATVFQLMTSDIVKLYKTKADAKAYLIGSSSVLAAIYDEINTLEYELLLADSLDKPIQEMINTLKKEQSRRENELTASRYERKR